MIMVSVLSLLDAGYAFYLAVRVEDSAYWKLVSASFDFNVKDTVFWGLIIVSITSSLLLISFISLLRNPEAIFKYFGCFMSMSWSIILLTLGFGSLSQVIRFKQWVQDYCKSGFS
jgi:hypothetical protein